MTETMKTIYVEVGESKETREIVCFEGAWLCQRQWADGRVWHDVALTQKGNFFYYYGGDFYARYEVYEDIETLMEEGKGPPIEVKRKVIAAMNYSAALHLNI